MENICCVCLDETQKVTNCNHSLCKSCYSNMYGKKCPMCRQKITKSSYGKIKKVNKEIQPISSNRIPFYSSELTNEECNRLMFFQALQNMSDLELKLLNQNINKQYQEMLNQSGPYLDVNNCYISIPLTRNSL